MKAENLHSKPSKLSHNIKMIANGVVMILGVTFGYLLYMYIH